ncbi:MAG: hypothetical protein GHCLOJNM_03301 [bacterium]|nr:hypothetical protein [bacterium]
MTETFNIYWDESCHLEHDGIPVMVLGAVWCAADRAHAISRRVRDIKVKHDLSPHFEIKWTKISPAKKDFYLDLVDYFFDEDDLHFRAVLVPDKGILKHSEYHQNHDEWYYKMMFTLLEPLIDPVQRYRVYLDIKDTRSEEKRAKLEEVLRNKRYDRQGRVIERVQQIRSHESELMQMADLLIGAIQYANRELKGNSGKQDVVDAIKRKSGKNLNQTTWLREQKLNLLRWESAGDRA